MSELQNIGQAAESLKEGAANLIAPVAMLGILAFAFREMFNAAKPPPEGKMK